MDYKWNLRLKKHAMLNVVKQWRLTKQGEAKMRKKSNNEYKLEMLTTAAKKWRVAPELEEKVQRIQYRMEFFKNVYVGSEGEKIDNYLIDEIRKKILLFGNSYLEGFWVRLKWKWFSI